MANHELYGTVTAATVLFLTGCGAANTPRDTHPESREAAASEPSQAAADWDDVDGDPEPAAESKPETDQPASDGPDVQATSDGPASDVQEEPAWSPETAQTIIDRARHKLGRRCDAGSQAACHAIPDLDKCAHLQRASCARLGELFARGAAGVDRNPAHARDFWWKACDIASADCVRLGKLLFDIEDLEARRAVAERFFQLGCTSDFHVCESVGRFYQQKNELVAARKFFDIGCAGGQESACQAKK